METQQNKKLADSFYNHLRTPAWILLVAFLFIFVLTACSGSNNNDTNEPTGTSKIAGKAFYSNDSIHDGIFITLESNTQPGTLMAQTSTDSEGNYEIIDLKADEYTLFASSQDSAEKVLQTPVSIEGTEAVTVEDLALTAVGAISGNVTMDGFTSHMGINVFVTGTSYGAFTGRGGNYTISQVPVGDHEIAG